MRKRQNDKRFRGVGSRSERTASERAKLDGAIFANRRTRSVCVALLGSAFVVGGLTAFCAPDVRAADEPTVAANVSATTPDAFEYRIEEGFVTITGLREEFREATAVSVPKQIGMGTVKKIAPNAFQNRERLETVVFADATALDEIGERAFAGCSALKSVDFGKSGVGVIGGWAFSGCAALTAVELPPSVRVVETGAFSLCSSLATVSGGDGVEEIAPAAFGGCDALETVVIGPNVREIGSGAFRGCKRLQNFELSPSGNAAFKTVDGLLTSADGKTLVACPNGRGGEVVVPEGVVAIGAGAFFSGALESVVLPQTLATIEANAFYSCDALKSVVGAPKALETIGVEAFTSCDALERFDWPENLQTIEKQAFRGCGALATAKIKSVRTIGESAFRGCATLETLELPSATREIGAFAFAETGLKTFKTPRDLATWNPGTTEGTPVEKFEVEEGNAAFQSVDGSLLSKDGKTLYRRPQNESETSWKIPDGVRVVAERALSGAASLTALEIPEGVETIGAGALRGCSALKKIAIPASLRQIDETFDDCSALATFEVAEASATFSAVDGSLLSKDGKTLYRMARNTEIDAAPAENFAGVGGPGPFATRDVPKGVERIAKGAFGNDRRVKNVEIPATVKQIDAGAFGNCPNVRSIRIPASVERLDERFDSCSWLATFEVDPANPTYKSVDGALLSKDGKTFYCLVVSSEDYRKNATLEEGDHRKKYRYVVPEGVETIKSGAFAGAYRMSEIVLPQTLRKIESWAFNGSPSIASVVIPAGVQTIEDRAFAGCDLREVVLASKDAKFEKTAFLMSDLNAGNLTIRVDDKTLERKIDDLEAKIVAENAASKTAAEGKSAAGEPTEPTVAADVATLAPTPEAAFEYVKEPGGATITGVREAGRTARALYIPEEIGGSPVRKIAPNAFAGLDRLETLRVDTLISEMGERAFADCVALKTVRFKEAVVGKEAFAGCSALETFDVAGVYRIEAGAFAGCRNLAAFKDGAPQNSRWKIVEGLLLSEDGRTLVACPGAQKGIIVPDGVVSIAPGAFSGGALETVVLPRSLETVGERAFANCDALNSVYSLVGPPEAALETIRAEAFAGCSALARFDWPANLQVVEKCAFQDCKSLESATIESVRKIGERAFSGCAKLATLKLPSGTREIGAFAFAGTALTSFQAPRDLETLTAWALDGLALESVAVEEGSERFKIVDGAVLSADGKTLYYRPSKAPGTSWKIPEGVRVVVRGALANNESLVSVEIPEGVEIIGSGAFSGCWALKKLAIPASVRRIDDRFERCFALETFEVVEGNPAYRSVDGALLSKDGKTLYRIAREGGAGMTKTAAYWGERETKRVIPEGVERIAAGAIGDDRLMTSVEIPATVKRIDAGAFGVCDRLSSLTIPASVERLDERFEGCDALAEFDVAAGNRNYTSVGGALLSSDFKIFYSLIGKGVWTRPNTLAPGSVYEYRVPELVQTIKQNAFDGAWQMQKVVLPQTLRTIERSAFSGATSLTSVTIPASVEKIEKGAFVGAPLREVVLESSSAKFDKSAFTENPSELTIRVAAETLEREKADAEAKKAAEEAKKVAEKTAQETFRWEVSAGGKATITGVRDKTATSLNIPETLDGAPVTDIGMDACSNLPRLKTVRIGANVERINGAFRNCVNLESVEFPPASDGSGESKLHAILNGGFEGCSSLKKFAAPVSLVSLFPRSFSGCSALETVELSPRTREIGQGAFRNCSALREINIPESDWDLFIGDSAFNGCDALTSFDAPRRLCGLEPNAFGELDRPFQFKLHPDSKALRDVDGMILSRDGKTICAYFGPKTGELVIPEGVERVGQVFGSVFKGADFETIRLPKSLRVIYRQAFMLSKSLKRVELPPDSLLEEIGDSAFSRCDALESFAWPKSLKKVGVGAFSNCKLKEFSGVPALESIGNYAFSNCETLSTVELPGGLREIGDGAFSDCGATSIKIPASVQTVGETAFTMNALEKFEVEEGNEAVKVVDGALLSKDGKTLRRVPAALKSKSYKIPDGVEIIERAAFGGNVTLETVEIPATVKTIESNAFYRCVSLKKLSIPASVEKMDGAFNRCDGLEQFEVDPKNSVYKSENGALLSADGKTFYRIVAVERDAEAEAKAAAEVAATEGVDAATPKPIYKNPVYRVPDGVEKIASSAFSDDAGMRNAFTEIVLPESVKEIGGYAFARCARLEKAFIPKNVAKIETGVFKNCAALKTVEISSENPNYRIENGLLLSKDGKTFYEVTRAFGETVLRIPDGVERIAKTWTWSAFENGPTYTEVVLPETLTTLGEGAFNNWENLTSITIPKSVKKIEARAFYNCPNLAEVVLRSLDTSLDAEPFYNFPAEPKTKIRVEEAEPAKKSVVEESETSKTSALKANGASADVDARDALEWREVRSGEVAIFGVRDKKATTVVIPETLGGTPVKTIAINAFAGMRELKTVRLPRSLETIRGSAFANCVKLEKVEFAKDENGAVASNLQGVHSQAFKGCVALKSFEAPDSLVQLVDEAFAGCSALETATLGKNLAAIQASAFADCVSLKRVDCSRCEKLTNIFANAFWGCDALSTFDAPKSLRFVDGTTFGGRTTPFAFNLHPESAFLKTVDGCVVTKANNRLVAYCGERNGVLVVPDGVEEIDARVFFGAAFETVRLPQSLRSVGNFAFAGCESLKRVEIPEDSALDNVGESAFASCEALETFDWPRSLKRVGASAFSGCAALKSLTGATSLESIGDSAFFDCKSLATVELPNGLREIGACAFLNDGFASLKIPASVKVLGPAGVACTGLEKIEVEEGNEILKVVDGALLSKDGKRLHRLPPALKTTSYKIPNGVEIVGRSALGGNVTLETVELPASVTTLERDAFYRCERLKEIAIPAKTEQIDKSAFTYCDALARFEIDPSNAVYKSENGALLSKDGKTFYGVVAVERDPSAEPFVVESENEGEEPRSVAAYKSPIYRVPDGVTTISNGAFRDPRRARNAFTEIVLPESLDLIWTYNFRDCENLTSIAIPKNVKGIHPEAFYNCPRLAEVVLKSSDTLYFSNSFAKVAPTLTIRVEDDKPSQEKEGGELETPTTSEVKAVEPARTSNARSVSSQVSAVEPTKNADVAVAKKLAKKDFKWREENNGATIIGVKDETATSVVIPETLGGLPVKAVGDLAFVRMRDLKTVRISQNLETIGSMAFSGCASLEKIDFAIDWNGGVASRLREIGDEAFKGCAALKSFAAPDSLVKLGGGAFCKCPSLETAKLGKNLQDVPSFAFGDCGALSRVDTKACEKLSGIANDAFRNCGALSSFDAPKSLRYVAATAFAGRTTPLAFNLDPESEFLKLVDGCLITIADEEVNDSRLVAYFGERSGELVVPEGVVDVFISAFASADFETVRLPKSVRVVNNEAFKDCKSLKRVVIPEDSELLSIGYNAFGGCESLETFDWPKSLQVICASAFGGCESLKSFAGATSVEEIRDSAFWNCRSLATVEPPSGLRQVGALAFYNAGYETLKIPASVQVLGASAFASLSPREKLEVEEGSETLKIVDGALLSKDGKTFYRLPKSVDTTSYKVPEGVEVIEGGAFYGSATLETVELPTTLRAIEKHAFYRCFALKEIAIPAKTGQIDVDAFAGCNALERFEVDPNNAVYKSENGALLSADGKTFYKLIAVERDRDAERRLVTDEFLQALHSVERLPNGEVRSPESSWNYTKSRFVPTYKNSVYRVPEGVTTISDGAFFDSFKMRNAFTEIVLPEGLAVIGANAFGSCSRLETLRIPASVAQFGPSPSFPTTTLFTDCDALKTFEVAPENKTFRSEDGVLLSADGSRFYGVVANKKRSVLNIPAGVEHLTGDRNLGDPGKIVFPDSLTSIPQGKFRNLANLTSATISKKIYLLNNSTFVDCPRLAEIVLRSKTTIYEDDAFLRCAPNLTIRVDESEAPEPTPENVKAAPPAVAPVSPSVNAEARNEGALITGVYDKNATTVEIPETIDGLPTRTIAANAFADMRELRTVRIPASVETIGIGAFRGCVKLEKIEFAKSADGKSASALKTVGMNAFSGCRSLKSFEAPDSLVRLVFGAFAGCSALETVALGQDVVAVEPGVFADCASLRRVDLSKAGKLEYFDAKAFGETVPEIEIVFPVDHPRFTSDGFLLSQDGKRINAYLGKRSGEIAIPEGVERIENNFFWRSEIETIRLPKSLRFVGDRAFYRCESLKRVVVPEDSELETIGVNAFSECRALERFDWPKSLKKIDVSAFCYCMSLTEVELPSGLLEIGASAFAECGFASIKIPASVRVMGDAALAVTPLKTIEVEEGNEALKVVDGALLSKDGKSFFRLPPALKLKDFKIPEGVEIIERAALGGNETLESVEIPASVTTIERNAFYRNSSLTEIVIPAGVKTLDDAFPLCDALERFEVVPENAVYKSENGALLSKDGKTFYRIVAVERDPNGAPIKLEGADKLSGATEDNETPLEIPAYKNDVYVVPDGVATLADGAFRDVRRTRNAFTEIVLPQSLERIEARAFQYCSRLETLRIPANVSGVGVNAFIGCDALKTFEVAPENRVLSSKDGLMLSDGGRLFCCVVADQDRRVLKLPEGVERAQSNEVASKKFAELFLPESLIEIKPSAFANCENLTTVTIPKSVRYIGGRAFGNSPKLAEIVLKSSATKREANAFQDVAPNCEIRVDETQTSNSKDDANGEGGESAEELTLTLEEAEKIYRLAFEGDEATIVGVINKDAHSVVAPRKIGAHTVTRIGDNAFANMHYLVEARLPSTIREIGAYVFVNCRHLEQVVIPSATESVGVGAFTNCRGLRAIGVSLDNKAFKVVRGSLLSADGKTLYAYPTARVVDKIYEVPEGVETIATMAFAHNIYVKEVKFPWTLKRIEKEAFYSCEALETVRFFPVVNRLETIGESAFYRCQALKSIDLPDGIRRIERHAFADSGLETVGFYPVDLEARPGLTIETTAFRVSNLTSFEIPETLQKLELQAVGSSRKIALKLPPNLKTPIDWASEIVCAGISSFDVDPSCDVYRVVDGVLLSKDGKTLYRYPKGRDASEYVVPEGVETIAKSAFEGASPRTIRLPNTLKTLELGAFARNVELESIEIPDGVETCGAGVFEGCVKLSSAKLPASLRSFHFASSFSGCSSLASIELAPGFALAKFVDGALLSPDGKELYLYPAKGGATEFNIPEGVLRIGPGAFYKNPTLKAVRFSKSVVEVGAGAFQDCKALETLTLNEGLSVLRGNAFSGCSALKAVDLPESVLNLGGSAFCGCSRLTTVKIPAGTSQVAGSFWGCASLRAIEVDPGNLKYKSVDGVLLSKDGRTLYEYPAGKAVEEYRVPDGVVEIVTNAFRAESSATRPKKIVLPDSVQTVAMSAFAARENFEVVAPETTTFGDFPHERKYKITAQK